MVLLPDSFQQGMTAILGPDAHAFFEALSGEPSVSIRKNPAKPSEVFNDADRVEWCAHGRYLMQRPSFVADPLFHAGAYYVQESSSMFLDHVLRHLIPKCEGPVKMLDLCAAPGGKSTLALSCLGPNDLLVSNEIIKSRVAVLEENLVRWGAPNVMISNNDPSDFSSLGPFFDIILVDAPCSGEGMFRKDPAAVEEWSEEHVALCAARQQRIVADVLPSLKPGGFLVYSTCTFNRQENEDAISRFETEHELKPVRIAVSEAWPVTGELPGCAWRFYPHKVKGEGLFMACLQKPDDAHGARQKQKERTLTFLQRKEQAAVDIWLQDPAAFECIVWGQSVHAIPREQIRDLQVLSAHLHLKNAGVRMGEMMKGTLLPGHQLALSQALSHSAQSIDVSRAEALRYLRKDVLTLNGSNATGISLLRYEGLGIGWVKVLPNRINNYLPAHLRIRADVS